MISGPPSNIKVAANKLVEWFTYYGKRIVVVITSPWIIASGSWDDNGQWDDSQTWND